MSSKHAILKLVDEAKKSPPEFGKRLAEVRAQRGDSLRDIEQRSGLNNGYLSQLENGKIAHPSPSVLQKVATGYGLRLEDLLRWVGYISGDEDPLDPPSRPALHRLGLGEPSDEELTALKAIVELLRSNRSATYSSPSDLRLDEQATTEVRRYALALLREADALGRRPTPVTDIQQAAQLVLAGELTLDAKDRAKLIERFGGWVNLAWRRLQGTFDFRSSEIWVAPDLHQPMRKRFVIAHEIWPRHPVCPKQTFAHIDDFTRLPPFARDLYEREADQAAVEILLQGGRATDEFDSSPPSLEQICKLSNAYGASIVATARYTAENSRRSVAVITSHHKRDGTLGSTHFYTSKSFEATYAWGAGHAPATRIRTALASTTNSSLEDMGDREPERRPTSGYRTTNGDRVLRDYPRGTPIARAHHHPQTRSAASHARRGADLTGTVTCLTGSAGYATTSVPDAQFADLPLRRPERVSMRQRANDSASTPGRLPATMERDVAFTLADELITAIAPGDADKLRPVLAEVFEGIQSTGPRLIKRRGGQPTTVYLLDPGLFIVRTYPGSTDLDEDRSHRRDSHQALPRHKGDPDWIWWHTTWRVHSGDVEEEFLGEEGPPHAVDNDGSLRAGRSEGSRLADRGDRLHRVVDDASRRAHRQAEPRDPEVAEGWLDGRGL